MKEDLGNGRPRKARNAFKKNGFALIVTISLMVLLTLLALGLLSLSAITLRQSAAASAMTLARNNAKLALLIAIGDVQHQLGPDQRVSATADMAGDSGGLTLVAGKAPQNNTSINGVTKSLSVLQAGTRYWTGVWKNSSTSPTTDIFTKTPSVTMLRWLVSGNENLPPASQLTPASTLAALKSDGSVGDPATAVVLAGPATVGTANAANLVRYVSAPLVKITTATPGSTTAKTTGRYAWWVGDEGVKAEINKSRTNTDNNSYASLSAQRRGWEAIDGFTDYPLPTSPAQDLLPKVVTVPETQLLIPNVGKVTSGVTPLQAAFHSATADSRGVLVDTLNGGTKIDLTSILNSDLPTTSRVASIANYPVKGTNIVPATIERTMKAPKWDAVKEFYDRSKNLESGSLIVKAATSNYGGSIAPLFGDIRVLMGVRFVPSNGGYKVNPCGKVAFSLANPYSQTLKWNSDLEIEVRDITPPGNLPSRIWNLGTNSVFFDANASSVFGQAFFRIKAGSLAPGEARAYTLSGATFRAFGSGMSRIVIDLAPFGSASAFNFSNCIELDTNNSYTSLPSLDVRESWQTTLIMAEMRLTGGTSSGQPLRHVERFELDNCYFSPNSHTFSMTDCANTPQPVPLLCYNFQVSQPGVDYINEMPAGYELGQRGSTLRTFMDFNLQATRIRKPIASYDPPPYFAESNSSLSQLPIDPPGGNTGTFFTKNLDTTMPWGRAFNGSQKTVLFDTPTQVSSLAQFQHADLTGDDDFASIGHQPGNAFGNSYFTPFVKRSLTNQNRVDYEIIGSPNLSGVTQYPRNYYDISYLLNASVWDTYFLSTIQSGTADAKPVNPSLILFDPGNGTTDLTDPVKCAPHLMIDGAFNVNSTDKNAWKAFLASSKHFKHKADTTASTNAAFPRSLEQLSPSANPPTGTDADSFSGYRRLTDAELDALATEIVKQVRLRGPFVSLAQFINRAIGDINRQAALTRSGALQSAIDESGATINFAGNKKAFARLDATVDRCVLPEKNGAPRADYDGSDTTYQFANADPSVPDWAVTSQDNNFGAVASIVADHELINTLKTEQGYRSTGIPGWLTQADLLQVIGPSITNRSDTFRIRAYGEALDDTGKVVIAKAYCEAIIQRIPSYVDPANVPSERLANLTTLNKFYGRQFNIISFRWLSPQEI